MRLIKRNIILSIISLLFQGFWEYVVCGYFYDVEAIPEMNRLMLEATFGDVLITLFIFNVMIVLYKSTSWRLNRRNIFGIILFGIAAAMYFESRALWLGRWGYSSQMIYLKDTNIGLLPTLQFAILIPFTIILENVFCHKIGIIKGDQ